MTHEDLLAKLWILPADVTELQHGAKVVQALRAVVELHKPDPDSCPCCGPVLDICGVEYPCPTIQVIEKELQ